MRRSRFVSSLVLIPCLGLCGLIAPVAEGAIYKEDRAGFHISIHTKGDRVLSANVRFRLHCRPGTLRDLASVGFPQADFPISPGTGQFSGERVVVRPTGRPTIQQLRGVVGRGAVHGRFSLVVRPASGGQPVCWSGRGGQKPWLRFRAKRRRPFPRGQSIYSTKRDGFGILVRTSGRWVTQLRFHYTMHCDNGRINRGRTTLGTNPYEPLHIPIGPGTGRFVYHFDVNSDFSGIFKERVVGVVSKNRIRGRVRVESYWHARCSTGRSLSDPWLHFVARRVGAPPRGRG